MHLLINVDASLRNNIPITVTKSLSNPKSIYLYYLGEKGKTEIKNNQINRNVGTPVPWFGIFQTRTTFDIFICYFLRHPILIIP